MSELVLPDLCDAYPDLVEVVEPMLGTYGGRPAFGGPIATVKCFEDNSVVAERVTEPGEGRVLVVDAGGSRRCGMLGDNLAAQAAGNGWAGVIVYGCVRDVDALARTELGIQALASHPRKSRKQGVGERDVPVTFGGVTFQPGAYCYADRNGVIVAPRALEIPA